MQLKQKITVKHLLAPQLRQSLKILSLSLLDLKAAVQNEQADNPFLEETGLKNDPPQTATVKSLEELLSALPSSDLYNPRGLVGSKLPADFDNRLDLVTQKSSLQDVLLRQLGMFAATDEELKIGQEIIGNIDENGYLKASVESIAQSLNVPLVYVENVLTLIQQFEPAGVGARNISECLLTQLELLNEQDPLLIQIVESHLEDVAKKNYTRIAKNLKQPLEMIEPRIKKILKLDPKPGRNYTTEETPRIIPDVIIEDKGEDLQITVNNEGLPTLNINNTYRKMLKNENLDPQAKEFLQNKLKNALELIRAISRRKSTLRQVIEAVLGIQKEACKQGLSFLKPLTFKEVAKQIGVHETTVCRVVMNKYVKTPLGIVALKDFFTSHIHDENGQAVSSSHVKGLIREIIEQEDKKYPLSDLKISQIIRKNNGLVISRRTITKYREELKILSTVYRKQR